MGAEKDRETLPYIRLLGDEEMTRRLVEERRRDWRVRLEGMWIAFGCVFLGVGIALLILEG